METTTKEQIKNFLNSIKVENLDIMDYIDIDAIELSNLDAFDSIYEMIADNNGFDIDIIYYSNAMEYLSTHDNSLKESLNLAYELGYTIENINSELLASILATDKVREDFCEFKKEIDEFFNSLNK
jgi:hypothetical protein